VNLDHLRTFVTVVESGSFSAAAKRLGVSQPAVSFQVQRLEAELALTLLDRGARRVKPTEAGRRFHAFAGRVLQARDELGRSLDELRQEVAGCLALATSTIPAEYLLPRLLGEFCRQHPAATASVAVMSSGEVLERVQAGDYEAGFAGLVPDSPSLASFPVGSDELVLLVPPQHPLAARPAARLEDLAGEAMVFREAASGTQITLERHLRAQGFDFGRVRRVLTLGSTQAVVAAVESGSGIAFVSSLAAKRSVELSLARQVGLEGVSITRSFHCVHAPQRPASRLLSEFLACAASFAA
jgi:DNA-binding transcriptional LysR family regulator